MAAAMESYGKPRVREDIGAPASIRGAGLCQARAPPPVILMAVMAAPEAANGRIQ